MDQYKPAYLAHNCEELNRPITENEFPDVINFAREIGLQRDFD